MISATWEDPLDPLEVKDYSLDASDEMAASLDAISSATWALEPAAIAAGVMIHSSSHDTDGATVWLKVAPGSETSVLWDDPGTALVVAATIVTQGGRTYHRSCQFTGQRL